MASSPLPVTSPLRTTKSAIRLIFSILLMDIIGITILSPVAPYLVLRYSDKALMVSMITILYAAGQFFAAPLMGKLGDRYGRRPVLLVSLGGQMIGYLLFGIGGALWVLLLARLIGGVTAGNMSTAGAYLADVSKPEERTKNFNLIGIAWGIGLILGPALGAALGQVRLEMPAFTAAGFSLVNVLLSIFLLPESLPKEQRQTMPMRPKDLNPIVAIAEMARKPHLGWFLLVTGLFNFAFNGINSTSSVFAIRRFSVQSGQLGLLMVVAGISLVLVQFLLVPPVVRRFGERRMAITSLLGLALGNFSMFFVPRFWVMFPLSMMNTAISAFTFPTLTTLSTNCVPHREVGLLMGVTTAIGSLSNVLGPLWAGWVFDEVMVGAPYWMGALIFTLAGLFLLWFAPKREPASAA